jgi:hypothetical protein
MVIRENVSLAPLTTIQVGGPARYFVEARTIAEVSEAVAIARSQNLPLFVLGGGSNLVISDGGWPGLVLKLAVPGIEERSEGGKRLFDVGAGEELARSVVIVEEDLCEPGTQRARSIDAITDPSVIASSLPHLEIQAREQVIGRYVGATTWQGIVRCLDLDPAILIDAVQ